MSREGDSVLEAVMNLSCRCGHWERNAIGSCADQAGFRLPVRPPRL
jgi:hypothetical protein